MNVPYTVIIENKAQKEFRKLSPPHDNSVKKAIEKFEMEPRPSGAKKLIGSKDGYRVRVGNYRILYNR